jgi:hypothetical protein
VPEIIHENRGWGLFDLILSILKYMYIHKLWREIIIFEDLKSMP